MNIFYEAQEFINLDNRRLRNHYTTTFESLYNKINAQLPLNLIENKTILDLGSCLGAAGYYSLYHNAKHYTGIEYQDYYYNTSIQLLSNNFKADKFSIIKQDIIQFLNNVQTNYDIILASGILYGFIDPINLLQKIAKLSNEYIVIDTRYVPTSPNGNKTGIILIHREEKMVKAVEANTHDYFEGIGSRMCSNAIEIVLNTCGFTLDENLSVNKIYDTFDSYNERVEHRGGSFGPLNYIVRYKKSNIYQKTIQDLVND